MLSSFLTLAGSERDSGLRCAIDANRGLGLLLSKGIELAIDCFDAMKLLIHVLDWLCRLLPLLS